MRVLVTGAAGFIGGYLCDALADNGHSVIALDQEPSGAYQGKTQPSVWFQQDIRDYDRQSDHWNRKGFNSEPSFSHFVGKVDACVHLAAIAAPRVAAAHPEQAWSTNVLGTKNVLDLCRDLESAKVVFMSSAHVYGISPKYLPTDERHPLALHDTYTTTKILGEQLCQAYWDNHRLPYVALRLFNGYGPRQSGDYFMGAKLKQAAAKKMTSFNGSVTKDWVHVRDIAEAILRALETSFVGPINIGTGRETSLDDIVKRFAQATGATVVVEDGSDDSPTRMSCDNTRAEQVLGWSPSIKISDGLQELIDVYL